MNDSQARSPQEGAGGRRWLLLIHQLPPKPDYLRVKVRRRLRGIGAVPVKRTVYLLPNTNEALEDFHWVREEIEADGGSAVLAEATFVAGISDEELDAMLKAEHEPAVAPGGQRHEAPDHVKPGRTWVTREGVHVDRIASGWLIRRFIDRKARFKFVRARGHKPRPGEIRIDMFDAEYTHVGEDCTFQTLVRRFGLDDRALVAIGEIVHDIDCKDERFGRAETAGLATIIRGIADSHDSDGARIERGGAVFDDLYTSIKRRRSP